MKKIVYLLPVLFLFACSAPGSLVDREQYDEALEVMVARVKQNPADTAATADLLKVYALANSRDSARLIELKHSGSPDIFEPVYHLSLKMDQRQDLVMTLPDSTLLLMDFQPVDYTSLRKTSGEKACAYLYAMAKKQIESGSQADIQEAYESLKRINRIIPGFRDVEELLADFHQWQPLFVHYNLKNQYPNYLPEGLDDEIKYLDLSYLNSPEYQFYQKHPAGIDFDLDIRIDVTDIKISPEDTREAYYTETAKVQDGIGYRLDDTGNFVYDSLGNKIEFPLLKTIACYVSETIQRKSMLVGGTVEIRDAHTGVVVAKKYITGESKFFHRSAKFRGNLNALSPETFKLVGTKKAGYPDDADMLLQASDRFKIKAVTLIRDSLADLRRDLTKNE